MFLHTPTLKKLLKKAFNSYGLTVANMDGQLILQGSTWAVSLDYEYIPNKVKGAVIELCGIIPEEGQVFKATKEGIQYEMSLNEILDLQKQYREAKLPLTNTFIKLEKDWDSFILYQLVANKEFKTVRSELLNLIDIREIDQNIEGMPSGPCCVRTDSDVLLWHNETCTLALYANNPKGEFNTKITELLKQIDFNGEE